MMGACCQKPCCATCKHVKPTQTAWQWVKGKPATQSVCRVNGLITRLSAWCSEHEGRANLADATPNPTPRVKP